MALTIYEIAKIAEVSPSTVSRALNGKPGVSRKNRESISKIIQEYDVPRSDSSMESPISHKQNLIGILTDDLNSEHQNDSSTLCQSKVMSKGYRCISKYIGTAPDSVEKSFAEMHDLGVSGLLVFGNTFTDHVRLKAAITKWLPDVPILLVYQNHRIAELSNVYCVGANQPKGFYHCVEEMYKRGRRRIALVIEAGRVGRPEITKYFEDAIQHFDDLSYYILPDVPNSLTAGDEIASLLLHRFPEVDGIICARDKVAISLMYALQKTGKNVPEDISIIGEDNSELCEACRPRLTSIDTMVKVAALWSVNVLTDVLQGRVQTHKITLDMELVNRETL